MERQAARQAAASVAAGGPHRLVCATVLAIWKWGGWIDFQAAGEAAQCYILMNESNLTLPLDARCGYTLKEILSCASF